MTPEEIRGAGLTELLALGGFDCPCGKRHAAGLRRAVIRSGAAEELPGLIREAGGTRPFLLSGRESFAAAGERVERALAGAGMAYGKYVFPASPVIPDERAVGAALMHFDYACDVILGVGSGVVNDIGKLLAKATGRPYLLAATAPSMDGFASASSSMERDGLKVSLDSAAACALVCDLDVLCAAPAHMLQAGVGDMAAKIVSLAEWRIAALTVGEYYCPTVAALVENALDRVARAAPRLPAREPEAVRAVTEGLIIAGLAMKYAGVSRPASGMEHYFSHIWDMRALAFPEAKADLHGIQCGIGTLLSLKVYEYLRGLKPDREKALRAAESFSTGAWNDRLRAFIGPGAEAMIQLERREGKYDPARHRARLESILKNWGAIQAVIGTLPSCAQVKELLESAGAPTDPHWMGYGSAQLAESFRMTKDIRDKYVASRLLWDLGELEDAARWLEAEV